MTQPFTLNECRLENMVQLKNVPSICSSVVSCDSLSSGDEKFMLNEKYNQQFPDDISLSSIEDAEFTAAEDYKGKVIAANGFDTQS